MNYFLRWFCAVITSLFLFGCDSNTTYTNANLDEYIWHVEEKIEQENSSNDDEAKFFFVEQNFPDKCRWENFIRVVDGDTLVVGETERVRFIGIDTPEIKHPNKPLDPRGLVASAELKKMIDDSNKLCLIEDSIGDKIDRYDRTLAYLFTDSGTDLNAEMIQSGWARGYFGFPFERKTEFRWYESQAKQQNLGLWQD